MERIVTDSLGFQLTVEIVIADISPRGRHRVYVEETGRVAAAAIHIIELRAGIVGEELAEVIAHEAYHLFYSIRHLITADEETEAEVFGQLVKRLHASSAPAKSPQTAGPTTGVPPVQSPAPSTPASRLQTAKGSNASPEYATAPAAVQAEPYL